MPTEFFGSNHAFLHRAELLSFEKIERAIRAFVANGVKKFRITGGEPMVRRDPADLVLRLSAIPDVEDLSMTARLPMPRY